METSSLLFMLNIYTGLLMILTITPCKSVTVSHIKINPVYACTGTTGAKYGTVQIKVNSVWAPINDYYYYWGSNVSSVACRSLGYRYGRHVWLNDCSNTPKYSFRCNGTETNLTLCRSYPTTRTPLRTLDVLCYNKSVPITSTRLVSSSESSARYSRVDVKVCGKWGSVSHRSWGKSETDVICRQMGYKYGGESRRMNDIGKDMKWYPEVSCDGTEDNLNQCTHLDLTHSYYYDYTTGVLCYRRAVVHIPSINGKMIIREGRDLSLTCVVDEASPAVTSSGFRWSKNGVTISGQSSSIYKIKNVETSDSGYYGCAARNKAGTGDWSANVHVDVAYLKTAGIASIISRNGATVVTDDIQYNDMVTLTCSVLSNPTASISWYKDNQILTNFSTDDKSYIIKKFTCLDNGVYSCYVMNFAIEEVKKSKPKRLFGNLQPDPPSNVNYLNGGLDKICLGWEAMCEGGDQQKFIVQHSTDELSWTDSTPISTVYYCVENLEPDTLYHIRVFARNIYGESRSVYLLDERQLRVKTLRKVEPTNAGMIIGVLVAVVVIIFVSVILAIVIYKKWKTWKTNKDSSYAVIDVSKKQNENYQNLKIKTKKKFEDNVYVNTIKIDEAGTGRKRKGQDSQNTYVNVTSF